MKILMVVTSHDKLGNTGEKTGFWLEEFAAPYYTFLDAGAAVTVASPEGGQPPLDPKSDTPRRSDRGDRALQERPGDAGRSRQDGKACRCQGRGLRRHLLSGRTWPALLRKFCRIWLNVKFGAKTIGQIDRIIAFYIALYNNFNF